MKELVGTRKTSNTACPDLAKSREGITADKRAPSANPFSFSDRECNEHFQTLVFVKIFPYGTLQHVLTALGIWHLRFNCLQHSVYACDVATFLASPCSPVFELSIKNFLVGFCPVLNRNRLRGLNTFDAWD